MENNCLVTTLKGKVSNDSLLKRGEFVIKNVYSASGITETKCAIDFNNCTVRVNNGGYFATSYAGLNNQAQRLTEKTIDAETRLYFSNGDYDIFIGNKSNLTEIFLPDNTPLKLIDLSLLKYCSSLNQLQAKGGSIEGDISNLSNCSGLVLLILHGNGQKVFGDISILNGKSSLFTVSFRNCTKITGSITNLANLSPSINLLDFSSCNLSGTTQQVASTFAPYNKDLNLQLSANANITGDIVNLASMTKLTSFVFNDTGVTGVIDELIEALRPSKSSGDNVRFNFVGTQVKYHASDSEPVSEAVQYTF